MACGGLASVIDSIGSDALPVQLPVMADLSLFRRHLGFKLPQCLMIGHAFSLVTAALDPVWSCSAR